MSPETERPGLSAVIARAINAIVALIKAEINDYKAALQLKLKDMAVAIALFATAALLALFIVVFLNVAAYQALTLVFAGWLAALILVGALTIIVGALALVGRALLSRRKAPSAAAVSANIKAGVTESFAAATEHVETTTHTESEARS